MEDRAKRFSVINSDLSETVAYNNPLFPAFAAYLFLSACPNSWISHWHKDMEFILIKRGTMTCNVNGSLIELAEGRGIMVNSRQFHHVFSPEHNECEFITVLLSPELLRGNSWFYQNCVEPVTENPSYPYLYLEPDGWIASIMEKLEEIYDSYGSIPAKPLSYFKLMENYLTIMNILYENLDIKNQAKRSESANLAALRSMVAFIEEHYMESIALTDIALSGACCKSKCSLLFKKYLRDTPIIYVTKLRLRKSLSMLLNSNSSIADIAYEHGFGGASYYCETFKKYYGISPLIYKKNQSAVFADTAVSDDL